MSSSSASHRLFRQLAARGISDRRVLDAMAHVPRENFVLSDYEAEAYEDRALPIHAGQTISQPYMVALMTQELHLKGHEQVLEIGTGSGYQAAVLSRLCRRLVSIERVAELSDEAQVRLSALGCTNVELHVGDGSLGWPAGAPYDGIIVTAGAPEIPAGLCDQLVDGGRLVIPVGAGYPQVLKTVIRQSGKPLVIDVCDCSFVPLIGAAAWPDDEARRDS